MLVHSMHLKACVHIRLWDHCNTSCQATPQTTPAEITSSAAERIQGSGACCVSPVRKHHVFKDRHVTRCKLKAEESQRSKMNTSRSLEIIECWLYCKSPRYTLWVDYCKICESRVQCTTNSERADGLSFWSRAALPVHDFCPRKGWNALRTSTGSHKVTNPFY